MKKEKSTLMIITGLVVGAAAVLLVKYGNPANMGFCIACFLRDTTGALKLHTAPVVQYVRPEIIGLILGAFIMSVCGKEFKVRGGSSPMTRFVLSFFVMVGALMVLGCPLRMILRIAGGDWNAVSSTRTNRRHSDASDNSSTARYPMRIPSTSRIQQRRSWSYARTTRNLANRRTCCRRTSTAH